MSDNQTISSTNNSLMVDRWLAYGIFRFTLGINILIHGVGRLFGLETGEFAAKTSSAFAGTPLPHSVVYPFLVVLPFAEAILGGLMIVGLLTRWTLALGGLLIAALVFGTALRSDWSTVGIQMVYAITYYFLLRNLADDYFSVDTLLAKYRNRRLLATRTDAKTPSAISVKLQLAFSVNRVARKESNAIEYRSFYFAAAVGQTLAAHGSQKLFGWLGGTGLS